MPVWICCANSDAETGWLTSCVLYRCRSRAWCVHSVTSLLIFCFSCCAHHSSDQTFRSSCTVAIEAWESLKAVCLWCSLLAELEPLLESSSQSLLMLLFNSSCFGIWSSHCTLLSPSHKVVERPLMVASDRSSGSKIGCR